MANTFKNEVKDLTASNQDLLAASEVTGTGIVDPYYVNDVNIIMEPLQKKIDIKRGDPALIMFSLDGLDIRTRVATIKDNQRIQRNLYKQDTLGLSWYEKLRSKNH